MNKTTGSSAMAAGVLLTLLAGAAAQAQTSDAALNALVKKGILTEKEAKDALAEQQATMGMTNLLVTARGKPTKLMLEGYIQSNVELGTASAFEGQFPGLNAGANLNSNPRIKLRRARIGAIGEFWDDFDFKVEGDFAQKDGQSKGYQDANAKPDAFSMTDVFINYHKLPEVQLKIGEFMAPYGYEMLLPDVGPAEELLSAERSQVTESIVPERQIGVQLWGNPLAGAVPEMKNLISYRVGAFDGDNRNINVHNNGRFMYIARLESVPFTGKLFDQDVKWRLGANALYFDAAPGTTIAQIGNPLLNSDGSMAGYSLPTGAGAASARERAWGVDQTLTVGPFDLTAEYLETSLRSENGAPITAGSAPAIAGEPAIPALKQFVMNGYYVQPSYYIWKDKLQAVVKYESFNPGQFSRDSVSTVTGGLNWYIHGQNVVAMLDYMRTWSEFRKDYPLYGASNFNEVLLRMQVYF